MGLINTWTGDSCYPHTVSHSTSNIFDCKLPSGCKHVSSSCLKHLTCLCRVAALAQERIHSADQQQHWLNLVLLLFAGADACDLVLREKVRGPPALSQAFL